jgi:hypothetical protein
LRFELSEPSLEAVAGEGVAVGAWTSLDLVVEARDHVFGDTNSKHLRPSSHAGIVSAPTWMHSS